MESKSLCPSTAATIFACWSIVNSFGENIYELAHIRKGWNADYARSLRERAQLIIERFSSTVDIKNTLEKLRTWRELMISSLTDIGIVRASVKNDFKNDKEFQKEFYLKLGYNDFFSDAKNGDHFSLFNFVKVFAENLTPELQEKILDKGLDPHIVDRIIGNAVELENFSECFHLMNGKSEISPADQAEIEKLYSEVRDISRIATAYYYFDPIKREAFNFFKALRNMKL